MQTIEEIDARIEAQRAVATQAQASLAALTETRAALKRKAEAQKPAENLVQRTRRLKLEKEALAQAAADAAERAAVEKFKAPVLGATHAQLRAVYDAVVADVLERMPMHGVTWNVDTTDWFTAGGHVRGILGSSGLSVADFNLSVEHHFAKSHRTQTRFEFLVRHVLSKFATDGLEITCAHADPRYSNFFHPLVLQCRAL